VDDLIALPEGASFGGKTKITIAGWIYLNEYAPSNFAHLIMENSAVGWVRMSLRVGGTVSQGLVSLGWRQSANEPTGTQFSLTGTTKLNLNQWYHIAATFDADNNAQRLYLNGALEATGTQATTAPGTNWVSMQIGALGASAQPFNGFIDEPLIFSRVLTATDIKRVMMGMHPLN
jgi:hypothetical protein